MAVVHNLFLHLNSFVGVSHDTNKQTQHNVNEERNEDIKVDFVEIPNQRIRIIFHDGMKRCVHIVTVDQREQALRCYVQVDKLSVGNMMFK